MAEAIRNGLRGVRREARAGRDRRDLRQGRQDRGRRPAAVAHYAERLKRVPQAWEKAFEVNPSESEAVRASCVEFVLAGLYATDRISRSQKHGRITYEIK